MTTPVKYHTVTLIGVGLLGGSIGAALKQRKLVQKVIGVGHRQTTLDKALACNVIDEASQDPKAGAAEADLIVVCTPAQLIPETLDTIRPHLKPGAVVTDVGSTKAAICQHAESTWPAPRRFVGSHPMAGSEKFGPEHSDGDLFVDSTCIVESGDSLDVDAFDAICKFWAALGARVVPMEPAIHDCLVAHTSHIPHILSSVIAAVAGRQGDIGPVVGNGFRDMTRIAAGRPSIWRDIALSNRAAILEGLHSVADELQQFRTALEAGNGEALEAFFEAGRAAREEAVE